RYHSNVRGATTYINNHASVRLSDVEASANSSGHRLLEDECLFGSCFHHRLEDCSPLNAGHTRGDTRDHTRLEYTTTPADLIEEVLEHEFGYVVVCDDAV